MASACGELWDQPFAVSGQAKADHAERAGVSVLAPAHSPTTQKPARHAVLVGDGVKAPSTTRRARKMPCLRQRQLLAEAGAPAGSGRWLSRPVRKLAKEIGLSLAELTGSGRTAGSIDQGRMRAACRRLR